MFAKNVGFFFSSFQSQFVAKLKKEVVKDHCLVATTENIKNSEWTYWYSLFMGNEKFYIIIIPQFIRLKLTPLKIVNILSMHSILTKS